MSTKVPDEASPPIPPPKPPVEPKHDGPTINLETATQWQLILLRFSRHKLAVASFFLLLVLYLIALLAEFFAPKGREWRNLDYSYAPPQLPAFSFSKGLHAPVTRLHIDPVTFRRSYTADPADYVRLGFFAKGEPYRLWGLIPMERRFFGPRISDTDGESVVFYFLGADKYGRDVLSRIIYGSRISLSIGLVSIVITFLLGIIIGGISGYYGGWADNVIQRGIEIINAFPQLPLWLALAAVMPPDWSALMVYFAITVVLSLLGWTGLARVVRGKILSLREEDYAVAARLIGAGHGRVIFRHLVPGFTSHIIVALTLSVPGMILGETALSFLGLGLRPPIVSWGVLLQDCMQMQVVANYPWLLLPTVPIILTVLAFNFLGDGMRDAADPYSSR
ncbi:MAG: ABC transporter permease [Puniceicoccaceae bacterium]|nr:MAG: ABC transporter permease [Puniceicoccaceae bacterium]